MLHQLFLIVFFSFMFFGNSASAQDSYQTAVSLLYIDSEDDDNDTAKAKAIVLEYGLRNIKITDQPWAEASFLQRVGSIALLLNQTDVDTSVSKQDSDQYYLGFSYLNPDTPFIFGANYGSTDSNINQSGSMGKTSTDTIGFELGYFVEKYTLVFFNYSKMDLESNDFILAYDSIESIDLNLKKIFLHQHGTATNITAAIEKDDYSSNNKNTTISIAGDYYLNMKHSVGASIDNTSGDRKSSVGRSYGINTQIFITPLLSIAAEFSTFKADDKTLADDYDTWTLDATVRF